MAAGWMPLDTEVGVWVWQYAFGGGLATGMLVRLVDG